MMSVVLGPVGRSHLGSILGVVGSVGERIVEKRVVPPLGKPMYRKHDSLLVTRSEAVLRLAIGGLGLLTECHFGMGNAGFWCQ